MRAFDQIFHDVALQNLPVVLCLDRGGLVGEDGATHHGCYDMAIYRTIPGAVIAAPKDEVELKNMMYSAMKAEKGPYIIRYPRGYGEGLDWKNAPFEEMQVGKGELLLEGEGVAVIAAGPSVNRAIEAAMELKEKTGENPAIYNIRYIKPIDVTLLKEIAERYDRIVTVEDGTIIGGLFGAVSEYCIKETNSPAVSAIAIEDRYLSQGTQEELREECDLTKDKMKAYFEEELKKRLKKDQKSLQN